MPLPPFTNDGDLPAGVHSVSFEEVAERFGTGNPRRSEVAERLSRIRKLALASGGLDRMIVFGSFVTAKPEPNDVDVVLVMRDDFELSACPSECAVLFDHRRADDELGASVFWVRPAHLFGEPLADFITGWGRRREGGRRGIVEVRNDPE
jgi:hypothetical protein